jgi:iron complex transport system permease protein
MNPVQPGAMEHRRKMRAVKVMVLLGAFLVTAFLLSMNTGYIKLSPWDVMKTLFGAGTEKQELVLIDFRLPRIVLSVLVGAGLAVSGTILQGVSRNALADPGLLGINAGAGLAVVWFVSLYQVSEGVPVFLLPLVAFTGASLTAAAIYSLAFQRGQGISPTRLILVGIAVSAGISAAIIVLTMKLNPQNFQFVSTWLAGSIWGTNWHFVIALLPWIMVLLPFVMGKARVLDILHLGEQLAIGLGTSTERERIRLLAAAVGLAGSCVAVGGGIGFVGLIGPHLVRRLVGPNHQYVIPVTALAGGLLLIAADTLARWILQPSEIPVGIVVAIIGAPYFIYLLMKT